jgi:UDP-N-acetylmuramyl tripeptide synthase
VLPFDDSRRLTGPNLYFATTGAVLEVVGVRVDERLLEGWRRRVERALRTLGWPVAGHASRIRIRRHAGGASLALAAPLDQLFTATEVDEWALCATVLELDPLRWAGVEAALQAAAAAQEPPTPIPPVLDEAAAMARFAQLASVEARPALRALVDGAAAQGVSHMLDDDSLTLGRGAGGRTWPLAALPQPDAAPWRDLRDIPSAVVTGSNGKTTTVRLIAACAGAHGWTTGYSCTDGMFVAGEAVATGDYSGPVGARTVLRDPRVEAAVLETARGGILRRGIAIERADAAVVTNVSSDHFGEYGIHDLDSLADTKLTVAALVGQHGLLVLNAEDPLLCAKARQLCSRFGYEPPLGWFALDSDHPVLAGHRANGGPTCGARGGRLLLHCGGAELDLGRLEDMPLTVGGTADYNLANLAAAALAATALRIPAVAIGKAFAGFGGREADNPGRLMRFEHRGVHVLVDYAHNPESLRAILRVAQRLRGPGRVGMLLGHAGNRQDADLGRVAAVAAGFRPDLVVVKEIESYLRGRAPGEVPRILREELRRHGVPESSIELRMSEMEAVQCALDWARPGDVLVLLVHSLAARTAVTARLRPDDEAVPH